MLCLGSEPSPKQREVERVYVDDIYEAAFLDNLRPTSGSQERKKSKTRL